MLSFQVIENISPHFRRLSVMNSMVKQLGCLDYNMLLWALWVTLSQKTLCMFTTKSASPSLHLHGTHSGTFFQFPLAHVITLTPWGIYPLWQMTCACLSFSVVISPLWTWRERGHGPKITDKHGDTIKNKNCSVRVKGKHEELMASSYTNIFNNQEIH